jgi:hypothetical protein
MKAQWISQPHVSHRSLASLLYLRTDQILLGNTTTFKFLHLTSAAQNSGIWGTASTGTCSVLFGLTINGYTQLRSKEIAGDVHSLAWGVNSRNLHALDSRSSSSFATSIVNFRISDDPNLEDIVATDLLANVSDASQIVSHPTGNRIYLVTKNTNELISLALEQDGNTTTIAQGPTRHKILPSSLDTNLFKTSSLALTTSKNTLWTFSQSVNQAIITAFTLHPTSGEVMDIAARASWAGAGEGQLTAAPFSIGDIVAITNSPVGYVTLLGLDQVSPTILQVHENLQGHEYLQQLSVLSERYAEEILVAAKIKSYGRVTLDEFVATGESVWVD